MNRLLRLFIVAVVLAIPVAASAQRHVHYHHYRPAPPPPPRYLPPPPPPVVPADQAEEDMVLLGLGVRVDGFLQEGQKLNLSSIENPAMWGVGVTFRSKFTRHWGLELGVDYMRGDKEDYSQVSVPITLSALVYLFPAGRLNPYGLFGGGVMFTQLQYESGLFDYDIVEVTGHIGFGLQVRLSREFALHTDIRFLGVYKNLGEEATLRDECLSSVGDRRGFCNGLAEVDFDDKFNVGMSFQLGATYFF